MAYRPAPFPTLEAADATYFAEEFRAIANALNSINETLTKAASAWTAYTPTVVSGTGTLTAANIAAAYYRQIGKTVFFRVVAHITTNGTGATYIAISLPVAANTTSWAHQAFAGVVDNTTKAMACQTGDSWNTVVRCTLYDGTYPGFNGADLVVSGSYEAA